MSENKDNSSSRPRFASQWAENDFSGGQVFTEPSKTVPDDALTIPEIIAKFTRSGLVPATLRMNDKGGNLAAEPDADPLDDFSELQSLAAAQAAAQKKAQEQAPGTDDPAPAPAGA